MREYDAFKGIFTSGKQYSPAKCRHMGIRIVELIVGNVLELSILVIFFIIIVQLSGYPQYKSGFL